MSNRWNNPEQIPEEGTCVICVCCGKHLSYGVRQCGYLSTHPYSEAPLFMCLKCGDEIFGKYGESQGDGTVNCDHDGSWRGKVRELYGELAEEMECQFCHGTGEVALFSSVSVCECQA